MAQQDVNLKDDSRPPRARLKEIPRWDEEYKVIEAARNGDLEELKRLKQTGYNFNVVNWDGDTAIHRAAYKGHLKCVQWLLDNTTIPVDHRNKSGQNILHIAVKCNRFEVAKWIINQNLVPVDSTDNRGQNILHIAVEKDSFEVAKWIINQKVVPVDSTDNSGKNILHIAVQHNRSDISKWIINQNLVPVDSTDNNGQSILHIAIQNNMFDLTKWMITQSLFPVDITDKDGNSPWDLAREKNKYSLAELIANIGHLLLKNCHRITYLPISREIIPKGSILIHVHKGVKGWFSIDNPNVRVSCTSDDVMKILPALLPVLIPLDYSTRIELLVKKSNLLYKIAALQIGDEVLVKLDDCSVLIKAVIRYRGVLPTKRGEYFGVELLEEKQHGNSDGTFRNEKFFSCNHNGLFVTAEKIVLFDFDNTFISEYNKQCAAGEAASRFYKVTFVGPEGAGKTSTVCTMLGKPFNEREPSTVGTTLTFRALVNYFLSWFEPHSEESSQHYLKMDKSMVVDWKETTAAELKTLLDEEYTRELYEKLENLIQPVIKEDSQQDEMHDMLLPDSVPSIPEVSPIISIDNDDHTHNSAVLPINLEEGSSSALSGVVESDVENEGKSIKGAAKVMYGKKSEQLFVKASISDFGGQLRFFCFQLLFLKKHDVIVLTINASVKLDDPIVPREELRHTRDRKKAAGMMTTLEAIHFWLQSISARFGTSVVPIGCMSRRSPTVIICCTHVEKISIAKQENVVVIIQESLFEKPYAEHLPDKNEDAFHFISNKNRKKFKLAIARLQLVVLKAATPALEEKRPISYLKLEETVGDKVDEGANLIDTTVFTHLANEAGIGGDKDSDAIKAALDYCSQRGVLLHFPDVPDLLKIVFICPQWLSDLFSTVINVHDSVPKGFALQCAWKRYSTYAILEEDFFDYILDKGGYLDHKDAVIAIMKKFDLLAEVPNSTYFTGETQPPTSDKRTFIVPSLLVNNPACTLYEPTDNDQVFLLYFPDQYLPESVVNQLLVRCLSWSVEKGFAIHNIHYGFGQFGLGTLQVYRLIYNFRVYQIKLIVSQKESCQDKENLYFSILTSFKELLLYLNQTIVTLMNFYLPSSTKPVTHISCPYCPHVDAPHVPYMKEELYFSCCKATSLKDIPKIRYSPCGMDLTSVKSNLVTVEELSRTSDKNDIEQMTSSDAILQDVQIVLVATSEHAKLAVLTYLNPSKNSKLCCCMLHSNMSCIIGRFGSCVTAVMLNERTLQTATRIVFNSFPNLCAVFAVGEAYGIMRHVKMWDVLVSSKLYMVAFNHHGKLERDTSSILTSQFFYEWFNQPPHWPGKDNKIVSHLNDANLSSPCLKHGNILSWNCSNDDITELDLVSVCSDDIIGIDMDGTANLSDDCRRNNIHFMIVKTIGHLGESKYDRVCQPTAALLAADCLHHYLSDPQLPHKLAASRGLPYPFITSSATGQHAASTSEKLSISDMELINDIIVPKVSAYWHVVLVYLEYDVAFKKELEKKHKGDPQQCCTALFEDWITSSRGVVPKTYNKLLDVLSQFSETSNYTAEIKQCLVKEGIITSSTDSVTKGKNYQSPSTDPRSPSATGEYELFTYFYVRLATVLSVSSLSHHLVSARILTTNEEEQLDAIDNSTDKATFVLRKIAAHLEGGFTESFHSLLSLIENHGDISSIQLVSEIKSGIISLTDAIKEYEVFIKFYGILASVLPVATLSSHLVSKKLLNTTEIEELHAISASVKQAVYVLRKISSSLQAGQTQSFYIFLTTIEDHGNAASIQVVSEMKSEIESFKVHHSTSPDHSSTSDSKEILDQEPTMKQLLNVVYHKVAAHWDKLAYNLNFSAHDIDTIRDKYKQVPLDCCFCLLEEWLSTDHGGPKTWTVLLAAVRHTKQLHVIATQIEDDVIKMHSTQ